MIFHTKPEMYQERDHTAESPILTVRHLQVSYAGGRKGSARQKIDDQASGFKTADDQATDSQAADDRASGFKTADDRATGSQTGNDQASIFPPMGIRSRGIRKTGWKRERIPVLKDISFHINRGEILGLVGESGCGKSTLARTILGIQRPDSGEILHASTCPQMVFQDPYGSLNPAKKIGWILEEPLRLRGSLSGGERKKKVDEMLVRIGLGPEYGSRYPRELSGGQRQRIAIASALMLSPQLLIADEPVSALDVTIQAQILQLLSSLQKEMGISILFISHDLRVVYQLCQRVMIMRGGEIVESGPVDQVYFSPCHAYTRELLESAGIMGEEEEQETYWIGGVNSAGKILS